MLSCVQVMAQKKLQDNHEIRFSGLTWEQALQLAKSKKQLIFIDAFAVWCGPCKELKIKTFTDPAVADYFNSHFINISMDMEKGEGMKFADQYGVDSYPTLLFIGSDGRLIRKSEGFSDAVELLNLANNTLNNRRMR